VITEAQKEAAMEIFIAAGDQVGKALAQVIPPALMGTDPAPHEPSPSWCIPDPAVPHICLATMAFVAEVIQAYINAGSEREAVMENETLYAALEGEYGGWADDYTKYEKED
jgi:hypothetical protein